MRTRMTVPILLVVFAFGLLAGPSVMAGELTVAKQLQGVPGEERYNDGVTKTPRSREPLTLPDGRVRYIVQLEDPPVASYRGGIGRFEATSPARTGARKLDMRAAKSVAYRGHLRERQESFARELTRVAPEAKIGHRYQVVFNGLSVAVNPNRVDAISRMPGVKRVYPERLYYQSMDASLPLINAASFWSALGGIGSAGAGIKVAVVDGGLYADHEMFDGSGFSFPKGYPLTDDFCGLNPKEGFCNGKIIVARAFRTIPLHPDEIDTPIGVNGHGTHVSGSAVGNPIVGADAGDGVPENISGVAPAAWLMVYKALWWNGAQGSGSAADLIAAVDAAVDDGADVINNSWGGGGGEDPNTDVFGDVFEAAEEAGVVAVVAAGNAGPGAMSIGCPGCQPSVLTVAASTHNRIHALTLDMFFPEELPGTVSVPTGLGCVEGTGPEFTESFGPESVKYAGDIDASNFEGCSSFPAGSFTDSIALISRGACSFATKVANAEAAGAGAVVVFNAVPGPPITMGGLDSGETISSCMISNGAGLLVVAFLGEVPDGTGQINYPQERATNDNWEDFISGFSSRGPNGDPDILKPEIAAPGQTILSAWSPLQPGGDGEIYTIIQGTSMASPHVAGAAALVLQQHPLWSPTEVKTALTSTTIRDGVVKPDGVTPADPFDRGAGRMDLGNTVNAAVTFDQTGMADGNCFFNCEFDRTLVDQGIGSSTWEVSVENADEDLIVDVTPSTIMLPGPMPPGVEPGLFTVEVNTTFVEQGQWHFADIVWRPVINGLPTGNGPPPEASMPLAVFAATSTNAALVTKTVDRDVAQPTKVLTYDISLTNTGLAEGFDLLDEIPANSSFIPGSEFAVVNGVPDPSFSFDPFEGPNGAMEWTGSLDPGGFVVVESSSPIGYLALSGFFAPLPCSSGCDDTFVSLSGFGGFDYFGDSYSTVVMSSNGFVVIGSDTTDASTPSNQELPDSATPNNVIAPFWTDIDMDGTDPDDDGAGIWYAGILTDGTFNFLIMEWEAVEEWSVAGPTYTFQVWIVLETSEIFYVYANFGDFPSTLTVGAEDITGGIGTSYFFNGAGTMPAVGTDLEVLGQPSTAHFTFQVETGFEIGIPIINIAEISSKGLPETAFASAITDVEELDVELFVEGECPGIIDIFGFGATPFGPVRVYRGDWPGTTAPLFLRNCSGTEVDLDRARQFPPTVRAGGKGEFHFTRRVLPFQCRNRIQAVDMRSCDVSNTEPLPGLFGDDDDMIP